MIIWGRSFQREGTVSAKALGWECVWGFLEEWKLCAWGGMSKAVVDGQEGIRLWKPY